MTTFTVNTLGSELSEGNDNISILIFIFNTEKVGLPSCLGED